MSVIVTEPAESLDLTTAEAVLLDMGATAGGSLDQAVAVAIAQASDAITSWCGRTFALETVRETLHSTVPADVLMLSRWPVVEIVSISAEGGAVALDGVEVDTSVGSLVRTDCRRWPAGRVIVDYRAGYVLPGAAGRTLPRDIERAAIILARGMVQSIGRDTSLKTETVEGVGSFTYGLAGVAGALTGDVEGLLQPHRAWGIA